MWLDRLSRLLERHHDVFADEDDSVLTRHDEELIVRPPAKAADEKAHSGVLLARTKDVQASTAPPRRSSRLAVAGLG